MDLDRVLFAESRSDADFADIRRLIAESVSIAVITGAGVSTDSGIPDFRGKNGLWTRNPAAEKASTLSVYLNDAEVRRASWQARVKNLLETEFAPNANHLALVEFERQGRLRAVITQNVDGLHEAAGHGEGMVIAVHGTWAYSRCWSCGDRLPMVETLQRVIAGDPDPRCLECGGILKSDTILFEEPLVPHVIGAAMSAAEECDLMFAIGTKLSVTPAANVVPRARANGAAVVIINDQPTDGDRFAHGIVRGSISDFLPHLTQR
ncbi:MAG: SIR2 family NAD-dependent protein deacylase [Actinomycetota bacterium]